jgi:hypothetical protein
MVVHERAERAALHGVLEVDGEIVGRDARGEVLGDSEVARAPRDLFPELDQTAGAAGHGALVGVRERLHVQIEIARGIEATFDRRVDPGLNANRLQVR